MDFLIIKADAGYLPLKAGSVDLLLATPPYIGAKRLRKGDYCTNDRSQYRAFITSFLHEATRILKPGGYLLMTPSRPPLKKHVGARFVKFNVLRKDPFDPDWIWNVIACKMYWTHFVGFESCWWAGRPSLYRDLLQCYSSAGDTVVHVFSGSGNSGIAALSLGRKPVMIDLHYHRHMLKRLRRYIRQHRPRVRLA